MSAHMLPLRRSSLGMDPGPKEILRSLSRQRTSERWAAGFRCRVMKRGRTICGQFPDDGELRLVGT